MSNYQKTDCFVKILVNPLAVVSFTIKFAIVPVKEVYLKIMLQSINDLNPILEEIKNRLPNYDFNVQFNWKNTPQNIKDNKYMQDGLLKVLTKSPIEVCDRTFDKILNKIPFETDYYTLAELIKNHIKEYGAAPDFKKNIVKKNKIKIHNYIITILGMPHLTMEQTQMISDLVV